MLPGETRLPADESSPPAAEPTEAHKNMTAMGLVDCFGELGSAEADAAAKFKRWRVTAQLSCGLML